MCMQVGCVYLSVCVCMDVCFKNGNCKGKLYKVFDVKLFQFVFLNIVGQTMEYATHEYNNNHKR